MRPTFLVPYELIYPTFLVPYVLPCLTYSVLLTLVLQVSRALRAPVLCALYPARFKCQYQLLCSCVPLPYVAFLKLIFD